MKYKSLLGSALILGGLALNGTAAAATPSAAMLANTCAGCHGTNGVSQGPASPTIAGVSKDYFIDTMKAYKSGERPSTIMTRIAKGYTDEEIEAMAGFFAKQTFVRPNQSFDTKLAKQGLQLHEKSCEKCHADRGRSAEDDSGILAGQWSPYLRYTFEDFHNGSREAPKKMKKAMEKAMQSKDGVEQLVNFYASQND